MEDQHSLNNRIGHILISSLINYNKLDSTPNKTEATINSQIFDQLFGAMQQYTVCKTKKVYISN